MMGIEFKLELSLRRIAMICITEALWKSQTVINEINYIKPKLKLEEGQFRYMGTIDSTEQMTDSNYHIWTDVIDFVVEKSKFLLLPLQIKKELQDIIILLGEKIFYFYDSFHESDSEGAHSWEYTICKKCITASGTEHFYSFSQHGTMEFKCPSLHLKNTSAKNVKNLHELFKDACRFCDIEVIKKHQNEIAAYLESAQPGLKLKNSKDMVLSIICAWYLMDPELKWERGYVHEEDKNGFIILPKKYFSATCHHKSIFSSILSFFNSEKSIKKSDNAEKDSNFIVPLEALPQFCTNSYPTALKYFANTLRSLNDEQLFSTMVKLLMGIDQSIFINKRLHYLPAPDYNPEKVFYVLSLMTSDEKSELLQENLISLLMYFLPVWPFQEMVPDILDFCFERNFNMNYRVLLQLITLCIQIQNKFKYKIQKQLLMDMFEKVWYKTPEIKKFAFLMEITIYLILNGDQSEILKFIITEEEILEKYRNSSNNDFNELVHSISDAVRPKWEEILTEGKFEVIKSFVSQLKFSESYFSSFYEDYEEQKRNSADVAFDSIFVV